MGINAETLSALITKNKNDKEILDFIYGCLMDSENYHRAVFDIPSMKCV
jgi:hypothetical protein